MREKVERWILRIAALISVLAGLLELLGAFDKLPELHDWIRDHAAILCVVFFGVILGSLIQVSEYLHSIKTKADELASARLRRVHSDLDPTLTKVILPEFSAITAQLVAALDDRRFRLSDVENFKAFYKRALESFPKAHFLATSIPSAKFFWKNRTIEKAIDTFIAKGGTMDRVFIVAEPLSDLSEEARRILRIQVGLGVKVYVVPRSSVPEELRRFVMVDDEGRLGWEPDRDTEGDITAITVTSNKNTTRRFIEIFESLRDLDSTKEYLGDDSTLDLNAPALSDPTSLSKEIDVEAFKQFEHDGWEQSVDAYDDLFGPLTREVVSPMLGDLGITASHRGTLLDVATGPGYLAAEASKLGAQCVGIDISEAMIDRARSNNSGSAIEFRVSDAENLEGLTNFDYVAMNFGILHLAQPEVAAKQAYQSLKPGGRFSFSVWAPPEQSIGFSIVLRAIETHGSAAVKLPVGPPFFKYGVRDQGIALLTSAGFSSPKARLLSLVWYLATPASLFQAFYAGTARTGGILRAQPPENLKRIQKAMEEEAAKFRNGARIELPMVVWLYTGEKFAKRPG